MLITARPEGLIWEMWDQTLLDRVMGLSGPRRERLRENQGYTLPQIVESAPIRRVGGL